ncbi:hypothetical protein C3K47_06105 [Solitalea longa]|uniref:Uncharacterized protein n=1 Tax=Solitalea longa TaxID=2079460 RepID=A0A2S5A476_9SPHI|nr:hypothetical protein [Solitalea longa]POY37336.1 hypothetical protein C3K47_06105 [Solitalea longa]
MKHLLTSIIVFSSIYSFGQNCTTESLLQKPGTWKETSGGMQGVAAADLAKEKKTVAFINSMIKSKYSPIAVNATANGGYNRSESNMPVNSYTYSIIPLESYCDGNMIKTAGETESYFSIGINSFFDEIYDTAQGDRELQEGFNVLSQMPRLKDGYYYFDEKKIPLVLGGTGKSNAWLITYDGKLPWAYVTKKEFLEKRKKNLSVQMDMDASGIKDVLKNIEIEKGFKETEYKNDADKLQRYMKMDYLPSKERYGKQLAEIDKRYKPVFDKVDDLLKMPATELNQYAIVKMDPKDGLSYLFTTEDDPFAKILIKPNPAYFNKKLPRSAPQFFTVYIRGNHNDPVVAKFMADIIKAIDFNVLKNILGKEPNQPVAQAKATPPAKPIAIKPVIEIKAYDIYKNEPSKGFKQTDVSQLKNVAQLPAAVNSKIKAKALSIRLTASTIVGYLNELQNDVEKNLDQQQTKNTQIIYAKVKSAPVDLADLGIWLYYKGATKEALWCLSKAASMAPTNDYIISNLTGIMNLAHAEARALPLHRYLKTKYPVNTTILNNLGQALYALGEISNSKTVLDSCIKIYAYHPQANYTRAIIAEKEGKNGEATAFIQKSIKGSYSDKTNEFAQRKGIKLDYSNLLNRYRPTTNEYINPARFRPPAQCKNVFEAEKLEAEWDEWKNTMQEIIAKINGGLSTASSDFQQQSQKQIQHKTSASGFSFGPLHGKAEKLYKVYLDKIAAVQEEAQFYLDHTYKMDKTSIETNHESKIAEIEKKYASMSGEGKGSYSEARCNELNAENNNYLELMAGINNAFNNRFSEPLRSLNIEAMYWSQMMPGPEGSREMLYYDRAIFAVNPLQINSTFIQPCEQNQNGSAGKLEAEMPDPYCPISFKFKVQFVKINGDCGKFEVELEFEGLVLNLERDFVQKKSTIAFGAGISLDLQNKVDDISQNVIVPGKVVELVEFGGGGVGVKAQGFIEIDSDGVSDFGLRGEASVEGVFTDKGDLKISGKMGVNSGVDITPSPAVQGIGNTLNDAFLR